MFGSFKVKNRSFSYLPRYYKPEDDPERKKISFERVTLFDPHLKRLGLPKLAILFMIVAILIAYLLPKISRVNPENTSITVEDIIVTEQNINK